MQLESAAVVAKAALAHEQELRAADLARVEAQSEYVQHYLHLVAHNLSVLLLYQACDCARSFSHCEG